MANHSVVRSSISSRALLISPQKDKIGKGLVSIADYITQYA